MEDILKNTEVATTSVSYVKSFLCKLMDSVDVKHNIIFRVVNDILYIKTVNTVYGSYLITVSMLSCGISDTAVPVSEISDDCITYNGINIKAYQIVPTCVGKPVIEQEILFEDLVKPEPILYASAEGYKWVRAINSVECSDSELQELSDVLCKRLTDNISSLICLLTEVV